MTLETVAFLKDLSTALSPFLALGGVLYLDRRNTQRQEKQFLNDGKEKAKQRAVDRRHAIYGEAIAQLSRIPVELMRPAETALGSVPRVAKSGLADVAMEVSTALAKLSLIAEPATAAWAKLLNRELLALGQRLVEANGPLAHKEVELESAWKMVQSCTEEATNTNNAWGERLKQGLPSAEEVAGWKRQAEFWREQTSLAQAEWQRLVDSRAPLTAAYLDTITKGMARISAANRKVRLAMRHDLELSEDPAADMIVGDEWKRIQVSETAVEPVGNPDLRPTGVEHFIPTAPHQTSGTESPVREKSRA